jgi:NAD(P)-dependent dehydrogenase (short-subunit alcohol dehydrogenase family)
MKVGTPADAGEALYFLAISSFTTGVILDVDGGHQVARRLALV